MFTELEVWNLFWLSGISNAAWFAGLAFLLWVSFRAANLVGESGNMIGKIAVTAFLEREISFTQIPVIIEEVLNKQERKLVDSIEEILEEDSKARYLAKKLISG